MDSLKDLFAYNAWADQRILGACESLSVQQLNAPGEGVYGPILALLNHILSVQSGFLMAVRGEDRVRITFDSVAKLRAESNRIAALYRALLSDITEERFEGQVFIPWWDQSFRVRDVLLQVIQHSIEHRADVSASVTRLGGAGPNLDYVTYVRELSRV